MGLSPTFVSSVVEHAATGVRYHFSEPVEYGHYWNGDIFVVSNGRDVEIVRIEPESVGDFGGDRVVNGTMLQPHETDSEFASGFDSAMWRESHFDAGLNRDPGAAGTTLTISHSDYPNGASVVKAVSLLDLSTQRDRSSIDQFSVLTITPEVPPEDAFRPAVASTDKTATHTLSDLDFSKLQSLAPVEGQADISQFDALTTATFVSWEGGAAALRWLHPNAYHDGYGDYQMDNMVGAFMALHSDSSNEEKRDLYAALVQTGIDYAGGADVGIQRPADGGHNNEYKPFVVLAASALNSSELADLARKEGAWSEDKQFRYITQEDIGKEYFNAVTNKNPILGSEYQPEQLGLPEWLIDANRADPSLEAAYRSVNSDNLPITALVMEMLGDGEGREIWGHEAYFEYAERVQNIYEVDRFGTGVYHGPEASWMAFVSAYAGIYSASSSMSFAPEAPLEVEVTPSETGLNVTILGDVFPGSSPVQRVDVRYSPDGETWTVIEDFGMSGQIEGLSPGVLHFVQARFINADGQGPWSNSTFNATNNSILDMLIYEGFVTQTDIDNAPWGGGRAQFLKSNEYREELNNILAGKEGYQTLADNLITATAIAETESIDLPLPPDLALTPLLEERLISVAELYVAYLDRAPDADGLFYWASRLEAGMDLSEIARSFSVQPETTSVLPGSGDYDALVDVAYRNLFDRPADSAGQGYWTGELAAGRIDPTDFMLALIAGARADTGAPADKQVVEDKIEIGLYFGATNGLNDPGWAATAMDLYERQAPSQSLRDVADYIAGLTGQGDGAVQVTGSPAFAPDNFDIV